jgi:hypothetical protein
VATPSSRPAKKSSSRPAGGKTRAASAARPPKQNGSQASPEASSSNGAGGTVAKAALGALVGAAAVGVAGRAAMNRARKPRVLGMELPRSLAPRNFKPGNVDVKKVAKAVADVAEKLERGSETVRVASSQAKRAGRNLS